MSNGQHTYQFGTIAKLRKIYETHTHEAQTIGERARQQLANAASHAALAHDAALLLNQTDPEWVAECEAPLVARTLRLRAWREMIDFLEAHPEIGIGDYETVTIEQPNGDRATPEFLDSLKPLGIEVTRSEKYAQADLWFGNHDVKLAAIVKVESPAEIEPVTDPAAIDEHQADVAAADADEMAGREIDAAPEATGHLPGAEAIGTIDPAEFVEDADAALEPYLSQGVAVRLSRVQQPIQVGDRVRVHSAEGDSEFPPEYKDREGVVTEVDPGAFEGEPDYRLQPIAVLLDGELEGSCFAVAEVTVLVRAEDAGQLASQPA